ncbi:lytic transglycosylase domain-containing protein [Cellulomonas humilata]|uniref:Lytic transglycosylase domain-containing protein n=1 Tax=Cellulomonas humilata TaxID=144055 RepID=A0A7Y5ZX95_9CELL|nr:lytic transglycosylase domain-containing protein [Cellulomonas humilata]NUU15836.1 lytic transglycosylase domain-containing protein [Cellulomonas humilata]
MIKIALGALSFLAIPAIAVLATIAVGGTASACIATSAGGSLAEDAPVPAAARAWVAETRAACPELPETWIAAVMAQESGFRPDAHADDSNGGTRGLLQMNASVWQASYGQPWTADLNANGTPDIEDPDIHARVGGAYLCTRLVGVRTIRQQHPDWASSTIPVLDALVIAHNAGESRLGSYPAIPATTTAFIRNVNERITWWAADSAPPNSAADDASAAAALASDALQRNSSQNNSSRDPVAAAQITASSSPPTACVPVDVSANAQQLAAALVERLETGALVAGTGATLQLRGMAGGTPEPGCAVNLRILQVITVAANTFDQVGISSLNRFCTRTIAGTGTASRHWIHGGGHAVDFFTLNGRPTNGADPNALRLIAVLDPLMPEASEVGQKNCRAVAGSTANTVHMLQIDDGCNHLHIDVDPTNPQLLDSEKP